MGRAAVQRRVAIVLSRCSRMREGFGIRFERSEGKAWQGDWAFAVKAALARREGYDNTRLEGHIGLAAAYPGCPHCGARSIWKCNACGKVACWDGETRTVTCPSCQTGGTLAGAIDRLDAGEDS